MLNDSELQIHHGRSPADFIHLDNDNGTDIIADIKFSPPIIWDVVFYNALTHSSARVITAEFIHNQHPIYGVIS